MVEEEQLYPPEEMFREKRVMIRKRR